MSFFSFGKKSELELSPTDFEKGISKKDAVLLDVRTKTETALGMLPNAQNIDFFSSTFNDQLLKLPRGKSYYVYCKSGQRSGQTVKYLIDNGFTAYNLKGGILAWERK